MKTIVEIKFYKGYLEFLNGDNFHRIEFLPDRQAIIPRIKEWIIIGYDQYDVVNVITAYAFDGSIIVHVIAAPYNRPT